METESQILDPARESALCRLLDDPAPSVHQAVAAEFKRLGLAGRDLLTRLTEDPLHAEHAKALLREIVSEDFAGEFVEYIRAGRYELETGSLMLDRTVYPDLSTKECRVFLDQIAQRCRQLLVLPATPREHCKVISRVLFHEYGFRGEVEDFDNPRNSFLCDVLRRRRGIPISLSIVYLLVARRCKLDLQPVGLPGRFMIGHFSGKAPFYVDPFDGGVFRAKEDLLDLLRAQDLPLDEDWLLPVPAGIVLCRTCRNLVRQFTCESDSVRASQFANFVHEFENVYRRRDA